MSRREPCSPLRIVRTSCLQQRNLRAACGWITLKLICNINASGFPVLRWAGGARWRDDQRAAKLVAVYEKRVIQILGIGSASVLLVATCCALTGCQNTMPSSRLRSEVSLPVPHSAAVPSDPNRFAGKETGEERTISAKSLIGVTFGLHPEIKSSYQRFKSEEARYDFFFTSRDSLTPRFLTSNTTGDSRADESVLRERGHTVELSVEKLFFDTTELNVGVGYRTEAVDEAIGNHPFVSADLRYPLGASREKLERTSEEIFRRNAMDDTLLDYIQETRRRLMRALFQFYELTDLGRLVDYAEAWLTDLEKLADSSGAILGRDTTTDRSRIQAEITKVRAEVRNLKGRYIIEMERLKDACGLPFRTKCNVVDEPFNPFAGATHDELFRLSIETDPEIATLRNAVRNAEVQLDLARRGQWDVALLLEGDSSLEGRGEDEGISDWSLMVGLEVSAVDKRVTTGLMRQAQANIARFQHAIAARENTVFVDTLEPLVRMETLGASREELTENLHRYGEDYRSGVDEYLAGELNIDDLLKRRENLHEQQAEISRLTFLVGANVAELCSATGKFFELLDSDSGA